MTEILTPELVKALYLPHREATLNYLRDSHKALWEAAVSISNELLVSESYGYSVLPKAKQAAEAILKHQKEKPNEVYG